MRRHLPDVRSLAERGDVVEDPERAPLRRDDQIVVGHPHAGDRRDGEIQLDGLPSATVVERCEHPPFRPREQHAGPFRVLPNGSHRVRRRNAVRTVGQEFPGRPVIGGQKDVRPEVVETIPLDGDECPSGLAP